MLSRKLVSIAGGAVLACCAAGLATLDARVVAGRAAIPQARGDDGTMAEFEAVCAKTQDAMTLPTDELRSLIARCDALKPRIDALDASRRKVYAKRLQLCRDLYDFVLKSRTEG